MNTDILGDLIVSEEVLADIAGHAALQCYAWLAWLNQLPLMVLRNSFPSLLAQGRHRLSGRRWGAHQSLCRSRAWVNINVVSTNLVDQVTFALEEFVQAPLKGIDVHVQGIKVR